MLYGKYSTRGVVEKAIQHEAKPSAVWLSRLYLECCISRTAQGEPCFYYFMVIVRGCIKGTSPRPSEEVPKRTKSDYSICSRCLLDFYLVLLLVGGGHCLYNRKPQTVLYEPEVCCMRYTVRAVPLMHPRTIL